MIEFENAEVMGWEHAIRGMRNPMNSWRKRDSGWGYGTLNLGEGYILASTFDDSEFWIGPNDAKLMMNLRNAGTDHRKFMRMITVYVDITAPLYWWKEFDTYKVGTVANSCSTMHKIADKEFELGDFSCEHLLNDHSSGFQYYIMKFQNNEYVEDKEFRTPVGLLGKTVEVLNIYRKRYLETKDKKYWWQMIQLLPSSYNQKRTVMMNYEVLANIYKSRRNHKLDEWIEFCKWIESLPYSELITSPDISEIDIPDDIMKEAEKRIINRQKGDNK